MLFAQALVEAYAAQRTPLYVQAMKRVLDDAPCSFLNSTLQTIRSTENSCQLNPIQIV